jgi:hypothetical protein
LVLGGLVGLTLVALSVAGTAPSAASEPAPRWYVNGQPAVGQVPVKLHGTIGYPAGLSYYSESCHVDGRGTVVNSGDGTGIAWFTRFVFSDCQQGGEFCRFAIFKRRAALLHSWKSQLVRGEGAVYDRISMFWEDRCNRRRVTGEPPHWKAYEEPATFEPRVGPGLLEFGFGSEYEALTTVTIETPHGASITAG